MIKIIVLILSFGLSTLTTLLLNLDAWYKNLIGIVGFGVAYVIAFIALFFIILTFVTIKYKRDIIAEKYDPKARKLANFYFKLAMSLFGIKIKSSGLEKIPNDTNFVLVQNHKSNLDPIITDVVLAKYPLIFAAKASLFHIPWFGKVLSKIGYVKLRRSACVEDVHELNRAVTFVTENQCSFGIYPEGTRNKTYPWPELLEFKEATFAVLKKCNKPIVVSVLHGSQLVNEMLLLKIHKVKLDILDVIYPEEYNNMSLDELSKKVRSIMLDGINKHHEAIEKRK